METFLGTIQAFGFNFAPRGWAQCNGQLLPISQNSALFSLLGTQYGGDGRTTFGLPDLRGRSMVHQGSGPGLHNVNVGQRGGREDHTLNVSEMPSHSHAATLHAEGGTADKFNATNKMLATSTSVEIYTKVNAATDSALAPESITVASAGGGQAFGLRNPYLGVNFCIALEGLFPPRS